MGSLLPHNSTIRVWPDLVVVSTPFPGEHKGGGKRGEIEGFTKESRKRLIEKMHKLKFERMSFVTLTYPAEFPHDWKAYKRHLQAFRSALERRYGKIGVIWRLEYQKRGAPHFHLIVLDPPFMPIQDLCKAWHRIIKSKDENHLKNGVDIKPVSEWGDQGLVAHYVGKYAAKVTGEVEENDRGRTGRHWGCWNVKEATPIEFVMETGEAEHFSIVLFSSRGRFDTWRPANYTRATVMGDSMGTDRFGVVACRIAKIAIGARRRGSA